MSRPFLPLSLTIAKLHGADAAILHARLSQAHIPCTLSLLDLRSELSMSRHRLAQALSTLRAHKLVVGELNTRTFTQTQITYLAPIRPTPCANSWLTQFSASTAVCIAALTAKEFSPLTRQQHRKAKQELGQQHLNFSKGAHFPCASANRLIRARFVADLETPTASVNETNFELDIAAMAIPPEHKTVQALKINRAPRALLPYKDQPSSNVQTQRGNCKNQPISTKAQRALSANIKKSTDLSNPEAANTLQAVATSEKLQKSTDFNSWSTYYGPVVLQISTGKLQKSTSNIFSLSYISKEQLQSAPSARSCGMEKISHNPTRPTEIPIESIASHVLHQDVQNLKLETSPEDLEKRSGPERFEHLDFPTAVVQTAPLIKRLFATMNLSFQDAQTLLDELRGASNDSHRPIRKPVAWLRSMAARSKSGDFIAVYAPQIQSARDKKKQTVPRTSSELLFPKPSGPEPITRTALDSLDELKRLALSYRRARPLRENTLSEPRS